MDNKFRYLVEQSAIEKLSTSALSEIAPIIAAGVRGAIGGAARIGAQNWIQSRGNISKASQSSMDAAKNISGGNNTTDNNSTNYGKERNSNQNYTRVQQGQKSAKDDDPKNIKVTQTSTVKAFKPERGDNKFRSQLRSQGLAKPSGIYKAAGKGALSSILKTLQTK